MSTMTSSSVSEELSLIVPEVGPNETWCAYRLISKELRTGDVSRHINLMFSDVVVTSAELDIAGDGDLIIDGTKQNWDDSSGYLFSTMKWGGGDSGWFLYMKNEGGATCRSWQGDPGDQGHLLLQKVDGDKFLLSTKKWADWYVYMQNNGGGKVLGYEGDPGLQGHWLLTPHPYKECFLISTDMWPNWYMYMQDNDGGDIRGWEGDPGDQGCWVIEKAWTFSASSAALLV